MQAAQGTRVDIGPVMRAQAVIAALWVPITVGLLACVRRRPIERERLLVGIAELMLAVLGVVLARALAVMLLDPWVGWYARPPGWTEVLRDSLLNNVLSSWMIIGVAHAWVYAERARERTRRAAQLEASLARARLESLSAQLDPHFLFNALNSVAELVHVDAEAADRMLVQLGTLLRASLDGRHRQCVRLAEELALLMHYLDIERMRWGPRLRVIYRMQPEALQLPVPHLILQPLVENAIRHGLAPRTGPGRIEIGAQRDGGCLRLHVHDDGAGLPAEPREGGGLRITRERLAILYGPRGRFTLEAAPDGGTIATIELPCQAAERP